MKAFITLMIVILFLTLIAYKIALQEMELDSHNVSNHDQQRWVVYCYDVINHADKHEQLSQHCRDLLKEWVRTEYSAPVDVLPGEVQQWIKEVK